MHIGSIGIFAGPDAPVSRLRWRWSRQAPPRAPLPPGRAPGARRPRAARSGRTTPTSTSSTTSGTPRCPAPGGEEELRRLVGRIMSQQLDRSKPLWEIWMVDGVEGDRWAMVSKTHHCMVDGVSGTELLAVILDVTPDAVPPGAEPVASRPRPARARLAGRPGPWWRWRRAPTSSCGPRVPPRGCPDGRAGPAVRGRHGASSPCSAWSARPPPRRSTAPSGPHRRWAWATASVEDVRAIRQGLRRHVQRRRPGLHHLGLPRAAAGPGRVGGPDRPHDGAGVGAPPGRRAGEAVGDGELENKVSAMFAALPVTSPTRSPASGRSRPRWPG